jgi:hypothetical protein
MILETAFLAQAAEVLPDGRIFVLGGGVEGFLFPILPCTIPTIVIVGRIHFQPEELGRPHKLQVTISNPEDQDIGLEADLSLNPEPAKIFPELGSKIFVAITVGNLQFTQAGIYRAIFRMNDSHLGELSIRVQQSPEPVAEAR